MKISNVLLLLISCFIFACNSNDDEAVTPDVEIPKGLTVIVNYCDRLVDPDCATYQPAVEAEVAVFDNLDDRNNNVNALERKLVNALGEVGFKELTNEVTYIRTTFQGYVQQGKEDTPLNEDVVHTVTLIIN